MLFGDFDWNRVLIAGIIGGAIGGLVALVKALTQKPPAKKSRSDKDSSGPDNPW